MPSPSLSGLVTGLPPDRHICDRMFTIVTWTPLPRVWFIQARSKPEDYGDKNQTHNKEKYED